MLPLDKSSVVAKPDKKLLTVLFPDGRDGRAFTLKVHPSSLFGLLDVRWATLFGNIFPIMLYFN